MDAKSIFAESPENEQWRMLLHYSYPNNIKRCLDKNGFTDASIELIEGISGSISQAKEYYDACKSASLQIAPLLLYYGTTNLLYGIGNLTTGQINRIEDHGMKLGLPMPGCRVADLEITPISPVTGALSAFNRIFSASGDLCGSGSWTAMEVLGSVPDILDDYINCYEDALPFVLPVEIVKQRKEFLERIEKSHFNRFSNVSEVFSNIEKFSNNYLPYQYTDQISKVILRPRVDSEDIGIYSMSGQKHLVIGHRKNGKLISPSIIILMYMGLYSLGFVCRYKPEYWNPFIRNDISGEKLLIEKYLYICRRVIPNLVLNRLVGARVSFVGEPQGILDYSDITTREEIEEIARKEIRKSLERERMGSS